MKKTLPNINFQDIINMNQKIQEEKLKQKQVEFIKPAITKIVSNNSNNNNNNNNNLFSVNRLWNFNVIKKELLNDQLKIKLTLKIRGEEANNFVPDKLYSSHIYKVEQTISGLESSQLQLIICKIQIINPINNTQMLKNDKPIIKGKLDCALTKEKEDFNGHLKVKFTEVSYHFKKAYFAFKILYYDPIDTEKEIFTLISPPFRVYARKPSINGIATLQYKNNNKNNNTTNNNTIKSPKKKRKAKDITPTKNIISNSSVIKPKKILLRPRNETTSHSKEYNDFTKKLDKLVKH